MAPIAENADPGRTERALPAYARVTGQRAEGLKAARGREGQCLRLAKRGFWGSKEDRHSRVSGD